jgi:hypothetical protein
MNITAKLLLAGPGGIGIGAAVKPIRDRSTKWRSFVVEGLPN